MWCRYNAQPVFTWRDFISSWPTSVQVHLQRWRASIAWHWSWRTWDRYLGRLSGSKQSNRCCYAELSSCSFRCLLPTQLRLHGDTGLQHIFHEHLLRGPLPTSRICYFNAEQQLVWWTAVPEVRIRVHTWHFEGQDCLVRRWSSDIHYGREGHRKERQCRSKTCERGADVYDPEFGNQQFVVLDRFCKSKFSYDDACGLCAHLPESRPWERYLRSTWIPNNAVHSKTSCCLPES